MEDLPIKKLTQIKPIATREISRINLFIPGTIFSNVPEIVKINAKLTINVLINAFVNELTIK